MAAFDGIGRSFEYCVTAAIIAQLEAQYPGKVEITIRAKEAQSNGKKQVTALKNEQRKAFEKSASAHSSLAWEK